jgi:hypothetical protein
LIIKSYIDIIKVHKGGNSMSTLALIIAAFIALGILKFVFSAVSFVIRVVLFIVFMGIAWSIIKYVFLVLF